MTMNDEPLYLSSTPLAAAAPKLVERKLTSLTASSATSSLSNDPDPPAMEARNSDPKEDAWEGQFPSESVPSVFLKSLEQERCQEQPLTTRGVTDADTKLPLTRLMERLRIHRTDARLKDLVQDLMMDKNRSKAPPLVLMTGPRGCGTSHVIRMSLQDMMDQEGGFFLQGKCHMHHNILPYPALVGAFTEFVHVVLQRGIEREIRRVIMGAMNPAHVPILLEMIPALAKIIGDSGSSKTLGEESIDCKHHQRFVFAFGAFVQAICKSGRPIVLFLQDLNLADASSLDYYSMLVTDTRYSGLILVGSCNSGVSGTSYLSRKLRQIEDQLQKSIANLLVNNLGKDEVLNMVVNALELDHAQVPNEVVSLSTLVFEYTDGNLLLIVSLIRWLVHAHLLEFDKTLSAWKWDEEEIRLSVNSSLTVDDYVRLELGQLSDAAKETLQITACLGSDLHPSLLTKVISVEEYEQTIQEGSRRGLLTHSKITDRFSFAHETVRVAAYNLISEEAKEQLHLRIGRRIFRALDADEMERAIFLVLSQLKVCQRLIKDDERVEVAKLCLHAGSKAARSSANTTSIDFLEMGLSLLGPRSWRDDYDLTLALSNAAAEIHMITASFKRMDYIVQDVFSNARTLHDKLPAYSTRICGLAATERSPEALELGKEALRLLGEPLPKRPSVPLLLLDLRSMNRLLRSKSDEQLLRMLPATNAEKISCMQLLHLIFLDASFSDPMYCPFIAVKLMKLTLKYGFSAFTAATFVYYGITILSRDIPGGLRYGALSLKFLQRFGAKEFIPRVYCLYYGVILHWNIDISETVQPLIDAYHIGTFTGDMAAAGLCASAYVLACLEAGERLSTLEPRVMWFVNEMTARQQSNSVFSLLITAQTVHHYMGLSDDPLCPQGDLLNHDDAYAIAKAKGMFMHALSVPFTRMIVALMFDEYILGSSLVDPYLKYMWNVPVNTGVVSMFFFTSIVKIRCARQGFRRRHSLRFARRALQRLIEYAPPNALGKIYMIKAELCSLYGDISRAMRYYRCAHALALESGIVYMEAIVDEYFGRHLFRIGETEAAMQHFDAACKGYTTWGAMAKAKHLSELVQSLCKESASIHV